MAIPTFIEVIRDGVRSTGNHPTTTKADGHLVEYFRQNFGAGGGGTNFTPQVNEHSASGGIINDYTAGNKIYRAHIFTSTDTFTVTGFLVIFLV